MLKTVGNNQYASEINALIKQEKLTLFPKDRP